MASKKKRMSLYDRDGYRVLDLGEIEIWDGADLALIRDTLSNLIENEKHRSIGVNLQFVKYIPSGFFGMLYDWHEKGVELCLYTPQPNVANMLWFRQFFACVTEGTYRLMDEPQQEMTPQGASPWSGKTSWPSQERKPVSAKFTPAESHP